MTADAARRLSRDAPPPFVAPYAPADEDVAARLLAEADLAPAAEQRIDVRATRLVEAIRARSGGLGGGEEFLCGNAPPPQEGPALLVLAPAVFWGPPSAPAAPIN